MTIQDRTSEFRAVLAQAQRKEKGKIGVQRPLLTDAQRAAANGSPVGADGKPRRRGNPRSQFAASAAEVGRGLAGTMEKLQRLAQLTRRRTIFEDRPIEFNELTYVIKQDLAGLNSQIGQLQALTRGRGSSAGNSADQEGEHSKNVIMLLQTRLSEVSMGFKDTLETRSKQKLKERARTEQFVSSVSSTSAGLPDPYQSSSPLYATPTKSPTPSPGYANSDTLNLDPGSSMALPMTGQSAQQQALMLEEGQSSNAYINERGNAIESIEKTINELGGIFSQLAGLVQEQGETIQRIDNDTMDVVDNVEGAQKELLKYWRNVSGNRMLIAKLLGVLMVAFLFWVLVAG